MSEIKYAPCSASGCYGEHRHTASGFPSEGILMLEYSPEWVRDSDGRMVTGPDGELTGEVHTPVRVTYKRTDRSKKNILGEWRDIPSAIRWMEKTILYLRQADATDKLRDAA